VQQLHNDKHMNMEKQAITTKKKKFKLQQLHSNKKTNTEKHAITTIKATTTTQQQAHEHGKTGHNNNTSYKNHPATRTETWKKVITTTKQH
jgi:hypothetical protein